MKAGTVDFKKHPARKVGTRSRQCGPKVPGRFAFPGARNPRICSISRFGKNFPAIFPGLSRSFPRRTPEQTPETATAFSSFLRSSRVSRLFSNFFRGLSLVRPSFVLICLCLLRYFECQSETFSRELLCIMAIGVVHGCPRASRHGTSCEILFG